MLTQNKIHKLLNYDPETGIFTWRERVNSRAGDGDVAGYVDQTGYRRIRINKKSYLAHRLAWLYEYGKLPENEIDHANGVRDDNRACNLRNATFVEQHQNLTLRPENTSGYPGVYFHRGNKKWEARIRAHGKRHYLGGFDTPREAGLVYREAKKYLHKFNPEVRGFSYG